MKKFVMILLIAAIGCSLIGCGKSDDVFEPEDLLPPAAEAEEEETIEAERRIREEKRAEAEAEEITEEAAEENPAGDYTGRESSILWNGNFKFSYTDKDEETGEDVTVDIEYVDDYPGHVEGCSAHIYGDTLDYVAMYGKYTGFEILDVKHDVLYDISSYGHDFFREHVTSGYLRFAYDDLTLVSTEGDGDSKVETYSIHTCDDETYLEEEALITVYRGTKRRTLIFRGTDYELEELNGADSYINKFSRMDYIGPNKVREKTKDDMWAIMNEIRYGSAEENVVE